MDCVKDIFATILTIFILISICIAFMFGVNSCSASIWNDGVCISCETKYELKAASNGMKYYACPDCGQEVSRY